MGRDTTRSPTAMLSVLGPSRFTLLVAGTPAQMTSLLVTVKTTKTPNGVPQISADFPAELRLRTTEVRQRQRCRCMCRGGLQYPQHIKLVHPDTVGLVTEASGPRTRGNAIDCMVAQQAWNGEQTDLTCHRAGSMLCP